ncbi:MAG: hypothetical protein R2715_00840 [Ilumatobacteraceae bacterium]
MTVKSRRRLWRGPERSLPFELQAVQDGHATASTHGSLLQAPVFTGRFTRAVIALAATAGLVVASWFFLVRPEIDAAAERAVAAASSAAPTPTSAVAGNDGADAPAPAATSGSAFDIRLAVRAAVTDQQVATYVVPDDVQVRVTDLLMQNPNGDTGRLTLLRNSTVLYEAGLENFLDFPTALRSPFVFDAGDSITVQLNCRAAGSASTGECSAAITLTGTVTAT